MEVDQTHVDALVANPSEGLNVELKRWIDPATLEGEAKIIRACLALRNRNGGFLVIGFDDKTLQPDQTNQPANVRAAFHIDGIQGMVSKFANELFEVAVAFSVRDGVEYPVIAVQPGVQVPVSAKRDLVDANGKNLISKGVVYFRTLKANGSPSTSAAHSEDWRQIVQICFDNREADIGRFFRRQLPSQDRETLIAALREALGAPPQVPAFVPISLRREAVALLRTGEDHFRETFKKRSMSLHERNIFDCLTWRVALVVEPGWPSCVPDADFLATTLGSNPRYTGWPIWLDARTSAKAEDRPKIIDRAWEALIIVAAENLSPHLDFMRLDPSGRFFLHRALQDDLTDKVKRGRFLDPVLVIIRVAEAIAVGISMTRALVGNDQQARKLGFAFQWTKLAGRVLTPWANTMLSIMGKPQAHDDEVTTFTELSWDTPITSIAPFVDEATRDLFATFEGERIPSDVIEEWTSRLLERRLN